MNTSLRTVVTGVLVVVLSAGLAMAGRGGGGGGHGGGGGGYHGGGGGGYHSPSFSTPRQTFNAPNQTFSAPRQTFNTARGAESPASRSSLPQNAGGNRAAAVNERPGIANTPTWDNRLNAGNRAGVDNRANLGNGAYVANRPYTGNNLNQSNNFSGQRQSNWNGTNFNGGNWHHGNWNGNWNNGWNNYQPLGWGAGGYWAGAALSVAPWSWGYYPYYNPYYATPLVGGATFDYSQPIVTAPMAPVAAAPPGAPVGLTAEQQATPLFDAARNAFMQSDYTTALAQVDQAIALVPNDTVLHEFRGLVLFAQEHYQEAAAADYAVLSAGPGWDWTTLSALYPDVEVYTAQLRALEQYAQAHPAATDAKFLLADHYLTCGYADAAAVQLKEVVRLNPKDQLSAQLVKSISTGNTATPATAQPAASSPPAAPTQPAVPVKPADASSLVGNWTATRTDSATIKLALGGDGKFTWALDQSGPAAQTGESLSGRHGKPQQFSGTYTVADNLLVLKQGNNPMLVGQIATRAGGAPGTPGRFNFKLAGDNPGDPGLTFVR